MYLISGHLQFQRLLVSISEPPKHPSRIHVSTVFVERLSLIDPGIARNTPNVASWDVPETSQRRNCTIYIQTSGDTRNGAFPELTVSKSLDVDDAHSMHQDDIICFGWYDESSEVSIYCRNVRLRLRCHGNHVCTWPKVAIEGVGAWGFIIQQPGPSSESSRQHQLDSLSFTLDAATSLQLQLVAPNDHPAKRQYIYITAYSR